MNVPADDWQRPGPTRRQQRIDVLIGVSVTVAALLNLYLSRRAGMWASADQPALPEQVLWTLAITVPICFRRRWPEATALLVSAFFIVGQVRWVPEQQVASGALFTAVYTLGAWGRDRRRATVLRAVIIGVMFVWLVLAFVKAHFSATGGQEMTVAALLAGFFSAIIVNLGYFAFSYVLGDAVWHAVRRRHQVEEQAAALLAAQERIREQTVVEERLHIARELHDVVAHHVSVMGIQAAACRKVLDRDPERAKTALTAVESGARTAVDELRRMLGALRGTTTGAPAAPAGPAGLDRIGELAERAREAGLETSCSTHGVVREVPESVSLTAYRIVQEAVTNTLKHAHASQVDIRVRYLENELELDVADDGRGPRAAAGDGGMGLVGMRERVAVHDGTLESGARSGGGFRVRARIPLQRAGAVAR